MNRRNTARKLSLSLLLAAASVAPAYAQVSLYVNLAPPPPHHEVVPVVPPGHVWAPGYWGWSGERHVWIRGRTIVQREGYRWAPDHWEQHDQAYVRSAGYWTRDYDRKPAKMKKQKKSGDRSNGNHGNGGGKHRG